MAKRTHVPLGYTKFHVNRCNESPLLGENADFRPVSKFNTVSLPLRSNPTGNYYLILNIQEAQLTLTNPRDSFRGQSRSPNIVPFPMLGIVSCCNFVFKTRLFPIFDFKNIVTLKVVGLPFDRLHMISC